MGMAQVVHGEVEEVLPLPQRARHPEQHLEEGRQVSEVVGRLQLLLACPRQAHPVATRTGQRGGGL
jgi:hypothetical protein